MTPHRSRLRFVAVIALLIYAASCCAQSAKASQPIKKIFVASFTGRLGDSALRQKIVDSLRKDSHFEVVSDQSQADAILNGDGEFWIRGYISVDTRASGQYPIYGGYLAARLTDQSGDTLWSYLVTPSRYSSSDIRQDLANQLARKMSAAFRDITTQPSPAQSTSQRNLALKVGGATFPAPLYQALLDSFQQHHAGIAIHYDAIGSEAGIDQLRDGKLTFAASDVPLSSAQMTGMPSPVLQFAAVLGAVVPIYNLPNAGQDLRFTPEILAGIFMGKIRRWDDPKIRAINHHVSLPDHEIIVVHRSDGSGTTFAFTDFLSKTVPEWKTEIGTGFTISWPTGKAEKGNDGVASAVAATPDSIGYAELTYAIQRQLSYGTVRNKSGNFVQANLISLAAAADTPGDILTTTLINSSAKDAYPITSFTWLLVPQSISDPATKSAVADFLEWMLTSGQKECSALAYPPLPKSVVNRELELLAKFKSK